MIATSSFDSQVADWMDRHAQGPEPLSERLRRFKSYSKSLYWSAVEQYEEGRKHQYRNFGVGAAALAFRPDRHIWNGQAECFFGFNTMPIKGGYKCCAERMLFQLVMAAGYAQVIGLIVVGEYQPDDTSGYECTTLHPCVDCRVMMKNHPLAWDNMPIMTALPPPYGPIDYNQWKPTSEWHTLGGILRKHKTV